MNRQKFFVGTTVFLLLLNTATLFFLWRRQPHEPPGENPGIFIINQLQLDEKQQVQFNDLRDEHQQALRIIRDEDRRLHDVYFTLLTTNPASRATVDSITSLIAVQRKQTELALFDHFAALRSICNEKQEAKLNAIIDELGKRLTRGPAGMPPRP